MGKPLNAAMAALAAVQRCALVGRAENAEKFLADVIVQKWRHRKYKAVSHQ